MATPQQATDPRKLKMELKRAIREEKLRKKQAKREAKMQRIEAKRRIKEERLRARLAARGVSLPTPAAEKPKPEHVREAKEEAPEAEVIAEADIWTPKSARNLGDIQKRIDRMDQKSVKSLKERYKERYGEDLEVPDIYDTGPSIEVETAESTGELDKAPTEPEVTAAEMEKPAKKGLFGDKKAKAKKKEKVKIPRKLRFFDYRTPLYLKNKFAANRGMGAKAFLAFFDVIHNIIFTILIIKILTTIIYIIKDRRERKFKEALAKLPAQPQPTTQ